MKETKELKAASYDAVDLAVGLRHPIEAINQALRAAIAWEDHLFNTEVIPDWQNECARRTLDYNQATPKPDDPLQLPDEPIIDLSLRRRYYQVLINPYDTARLNATSVDAVEYDDQQLLTIHTMATQDKPADELARLKKLTGIEFDGVMCSATKEDMWGLASVEPFVRTGADTRFKFDNGQVLTLTADNIDAFKAVWVPFRAAFF